MNAEIIGARQFTILVFLYSIGTAVLVIPAVMVGEVKQDAWISSTVGVVLSFLVIKLFISLANRTPNLSFVEANKKILGKFIGKLTAVGFIIMTFISASQLLYYIGSFLQTEVMPETPPVTFAILVNLALIYATYLGIEVFARSAEILLPVFSLLFLIFVICISPEIDVKNVQPILETTASPFISGTIIFMSIHSLPLIVLLMIFPSAINEHKSAQKGFYIGTIAGGAVLTIIIVLCILVLGVTSTSSRTFPSYALAQRISIGNFLQRIEVVMAFIWFISIFIRLYLYFYATVKGLGQILNIKDHRQLILPLAMISTAISQIIHPNIIHSTEYNKVTWPLFISSFAILLPLLLLIVAKLRKINPAEKDSNTINERVDNEENNIN
ncbi:GerAB/ArcD/ProY family transporter [Lysinibacillus sphaericus]|uniref:Variant surface antigen E (VlpE prolipoprotein) n=1 Tax=Lysinibacillus sphaericus OT4b.31 TaxID=1285586 RepID=R7Z8E1_LYSSH|nr:endospore germination permease [Lysinibacillus sphaericus]EON70378.1 variant surface antigen E (VlpE prolipoprotein) [Lysinibacillus sphaericus OT4b.31]